MSNGKTMLIAYDGTERADRALEYAAQLLRPSTVEILTAWEPVARQTARAVSRTGMHQSTVSPDSVEDDPAYEEALKICRQGTQLAENLGLAGRAHLVESATTISSAIVDAAHELDVDVIVTGTRALTGFRAWWTNSTADQIVRNAGLPVFIVPQENDEDAEEDDPEYF
ncbi:MULTISPECIES: universal stress protein [Corynebacterium]|uniref:Universal stress protein n=2 Tax=Corynebacterium TaxID=1716 RepID=A0ABT7FLP4_9CORY|nr:MULTISPECIES: universal stress protein [Corynebacterium]EFM42687.1 universal stress family protein [Corynebacterium accolens ATCC 49726]MDK4246506.1 universal stress protein [Corynebacterium accolens]MDK4295098.1 universal stress protein [Corynebacterium accolens]MDK4331110.1 universal stress protein [Corynebacterium accolens]MDK8469879.1 universal stress protein [Corynebacterium accolens]